jgi:beta-phosphoglucomutase-like phosphatase (HAD superfamily)
LFAGSRHTTAPGFTSFLEQVHQLGLPAAIGSLTHRYDALRLAERAGLVGSVQVIVTLEDVENLKPAPDVFLETARRLCIKPTEQIVFEDSPNGVKAARTAGSIPIGMPVYKRPETISRLIHEGARRIFYDWRDINLVGLLESLTEECGQ